MSDPIENNFHLYRRARRAILANQCQFCLGPTAGNNFLSCPRCFVNFESIPPQVFQNSDDDDDDDLPPLISINPPISRNSG